MGTQRSVHFGSHSPLTLGDCCSENDFKMTAPGRFVISSVPGAAMVTLISECGWTPSGVCIQVWSGDPRLMEHIQYLDGARQFNLNLLRLRGGIRGVTSRRYRAGRKRMA
jgi:hypothetical protein